MGKGPHQVTNPNQTPNAGEKSTGVRLRELTFVVERETTQTVS